LKASEPNDQIFPTSGVDDSGTAMLSILVKRTYRLDPERGCVFADEQLPMHTLIPGEDDPERVVQEADLPPLKELTDVIVRGHVHSARATNRMSASVSVGPTTKELLVHGDRRCTRAATGEIVFSDPERFEKMPLAYDRAYGGTDQVALAKHGNPYAEWMAYAPEIAQRSRHSPYRYPRNGIGRGYLYEVTDEALDALALPNLEDPSDPVSPSRLVVGGMRNWPTMPLPWCTDWLSLGAFPRTAYYGPTVDFAIAPDEFAEVVRGFTPKGRIRKGLRPEYAWLRLTNAGSLGLQLGPFGAAALPHLEFRLVNMHPTRPRLSFHLPPGAPDIWVDGRKGDGKLVQTTPVLHHVVIEPDLDRVSVVWRGSAPVLRRYTLDETHQMPLSVSWPEDGKAIS
jgi:hypothetical protein